MKTAPRVLGVMATAVALALLAALPGGAATPVGSGTPACLRGHWVANQAETRRVVQSLVPVPGMEVNSRLYMLFQDGIYQYGTTSMIIRNTIGDTIMTAKARFFTLARYTARNGVFTLARGESTVEFGEFTAQKDGRTYTVPGPPTRTTSIPGGPVPFRCAGSTLRVKLPRISSLGWITLHRG